MAHEPGSATSLLTQDADHCIYYHDRDTDSCSKEMRNRKDGGFKTNALGVTITGGPLGEKMDSDVRAHSCGTGRRTVKLNVGLSISRATAVPVPT